MLDLDTVDGPSRNVNWLTEATLCGDVASYSPADVQTDSVGVNHTAYESGGTQRRALMVYPDAATAHRMARDLVGKFEACPRYPTDTGDSGAGEATNEVTPRDVGDEAWTVKTATSSMASRTSGRPSTSWSAWERRDVPDAQQRGTGPDQARLLLRRPRRPRQALS